MATKGTVITTETLANKIETNTKAGYKYFTSNLPVTIVEDINSNIVKVYYVKEEVIDPENPDIPVEETSGYKIEGKSGRSKSKWIL